MLTVVLLVLPLGLETFAVSAAVGVARMPAPDRTRLAFTLSGFEAGAPLAGLAMGEALGQAITGVADYVAIAVLLAFGAYMMAGEDSGDEERMERLTRVRGWALVLLALSVSVDEIAIGFTLGLLDVPLVPVLIAIALQAFVAAQLGVRAGARLGDRVRKNAERLAGLLLVLLAVALLGIELAG
jgi:putative Mn2+ efflux pump MntP